MTIFTSKITLHDTHTTPHTHTHARTHARTHALTHARTHARTHAHTHTRTHTQPSPRTHRPYAHRQWHLLGRVESTPLSPFSLRIHTTALTVCPNEVFLRSAAPTASREKEQTPRLTHREQQRYNIGNWITAYACKVTHKISISERKRTEWKKSRKLRMNT